MLNREGQLSPKLRLKLVECLHAYLLVDPGSNWMVISERRRKKEREGEDGGEGWGGEGVWRGRREWVS